VSAFDLRLRPVRLSDEQHVRSAHQELGVEAFDFAIGLGPDTSWPEYVQQLDLARRATQLPEPWVPATFLLAFVGEDLVGRTSIRHRLNDFLLAAGGHIGYAVLPRFRRQGVATEILTQSLVVARSYDVGRVLVTCDEDNDASARVITRCGGVLENIVDNPEGGPRKRRYWID
jgi:predicted acetyltransferase